MAKNEADCPVGQIITSVSECKVASAALGLNYKWHVGKYDRPAGCYGFTTGNQNSYLNLESFTSPIDDTAGICKTGILNLVLFLNGPVLKIIHL